jgi:hypothetical protein
VLAHSILLCLAITPQDDANAETIKAAFDVIDDLPEELAVDLFEQLRMEASWRDDFRAGLQSYLLKKPPRDPGTWPLKSPAPIYDPEKHCPAQPIPRRRLKESDPRATRALERFKLTDDGPVVMPGWTYDYASRELRRETGWDSPKRALKNAVLGSPPGQDLAIAFLELNLDSGEMRATFAAFSHAYADRTGKVFPGVTLYDAWASGSQMEMPDVECLGIIHDLRDDWKTWKAPVRKQEPLYDAIGELFFPARQHRGLRHALAVAYLVGDRGSLGDYASNHLQLQALWEDSASTPAKLAERLPGSKGWRVFLEDWRDHVDAQESLQRKAATRSNALTRSAVDIRGLALRILRENDLLKE